MWLITWRMALLSSAISIFIVYSSPYLTIKFWTVKRSFNWPKKAGLPAHLF